MIQRIPNSKIVCCASIFALSLAACSQNPKVKTDNLANNGANSSTNHIVKLKKGHRSKKLGLALPDPRSYDNIWDRLFDRFDLPAVDHPDIDRELNWFINHPAYIERVQSRAEPFLYSIVKQLEKHNMPGELALLPVIESAFQPHVVSPAHAAGIWQFIPATGRHYGLKQSHSYDGRRDIYASTRAAIKYLKKLHNDFGDWLLAIAGYNCGEGAVSRAIQRNLARGLPTDFWSLDLPQETRSYVPRLLAVAKLFSESEQYGFDLRPIPNQPLYKTVKLNQQVDLALAANAADISLDKLYELNPGFKRQHVDLDGSYRLFIPAHKKIVDFKEELARQMASSQGYAERDAQADSSPAYASSSAAPQQAAAEPAALAESPAPAEPPAAVEPPTPARQPEPAAEPAAAVEAPAALADPYAEPPASGGVSASTENYAPEPQAGTGEPAQTYAASETLASVSPEWAEPKPRTRKNPGDIPAEQTAAKAEDYEQPATASKKAAAKEIQASLPPEWAQAKPPSARKGISDSTPEYERPATAKDRQALKAVSLKAEQKLREEAAAEERKKAAEREALTQSRAGRKPALKARDEPEPGTPGKKTAYVIQEGDTAYSIARRYDMDLEDLKKMNHISRAEDIKWGQSVTVVSKETPKEAGRKQAAAGGKAASRQQPSAAKYTARDGETLFSISRRFNVTVADLRKWNGIKEDKQFRAGMNITVSGEKD